jgi:phosphoribosyl 1,2-cyclic phosphate phosphodiesterase
MKITVLGCGSSMGVPAIGNAWGNCDPANPRNIRHRTSILLERQGKTILIDAGPDLRQQLLNAEVKELTAVLFTHYHADHTQGIDDLRAFYLHSKYATPVYGTQQTLAEIHQRFPQMFRDNGFEGFKDKSFLTSHTIEATAGLPDFGIQTFPQDHHVCQTLGIRCGRFAYSTDWINLDEAAEAALQNLDVWIVSALRREPHVAHASLPQVLAWVERLKPARTILTHMNATLDYETLRRELPPNVEPAYDGMVIALDD